MVTPHPSTESLREGRNADVSPRIEVEPLAGTSTFCSRVYDALKQAITKVNIYAQPGEVRLDERQLARELGISRTPVRMAMALLENEGIVRTVHCRGVFVVRKTKKEAIEMIQVWAALESMAARLVAMRGSNEDIAALRAILGDYENGHDRIRTAEYSEANTAFHEAIIRTSRCSLIGQVTDRLMIHIRPIRHMSVAHDDRARHSMKDHLDIIEAIEQRNAPQAERLVRRHTLGLADHIEKHCDFLR